MNNSWQRTFRLPHGHRVTFSYGPRGLKCVAEPWPPARLSERRQRRLYEAYCAARMQFMTEVATLRGNDVIVVDGEGVHVFRPKRRQ